MLTQRLSNVWKLRCQISSNGLLKLVYNKWSEENLFHPEREDENVEEKEEAVPIKKSREEIIPRASSTYTKELAKSPLYARAIFYLFEHGIAYQTEIWETLGCTQGTVSMMMKKLGEMGIVKIIKQMERERPVLDKTRVFYKLSKGGNNLNFITELQKWFEYERLRAIERLFSLEWVKVEELKNDERFKWTLWRYGIKFEEALGIIKDSGIFYIQNNYDDELTAIKRAFDNFGRRIEEEESEIEEVTPTESKLEESEEEAIEVEVPE